MSFELLKQTIIASLKYDLTQATANFKGTFADILNHPVTHTEGFILLASLVPHVLPHFYDSIIDDIFPEGGQLVALGGVRDGNNYRAFMPTGETIQYLLAKDDIAQRLLLQHYFEPSHWFYKNKILRLETYKEGMPFMSGKIIMTPSIVHQLLFGSSYIPPFSTEFPLQQIHTLLKWDDLSVNDEIKEQLNHIIMWLEYKSKLYKDKNFNRFINQGFKALFHGPPGTGKTLSAMLIAQHKEIPIFRIDLSQISSKYIGETEKNLERIFDFAEYQNWILLFDEADALFGKRTNVKSANDRYANQEVSFLLQRMEQYNGLIILTSNFKNNIDEAFLRRFNSIIKFNVPNAEARLEIWMRAQPATLNWDKNFIQKLAANYELTAAQIINIIAYVTIKTFASNNKTITNETLLQGIQQEYNKDERIFNPL
jgi:AAA+ superfamily predicted ATPase